MSALAHTVPELTVESMLRLMMLTEFGLLLLPTRLPETVSTLPEVSVYVNPGLATSISLAPDQDSPLFQSPDPPLLPFRSPVL